MSVTMFLALEGLCDHSYQCPLGVCVSLGYVLICAISCICKGKVAATSPSLGRDPRSPGMGLGPRNQTEGVLGQSSWRRPPHSSPCLIVSSCCGC